MIEYALPQINDSQACYRLLTTMPDPVTAPAMELAAIHHTRWEVEAVFDELKTHLLKSRRVLRNKTPQLVRREQPRCEDFPARAAEKAAAILDQGAGRKRDAARHPNAQPARPTHGQTQKLSKCAA